MAERYPGGVISKTPPVITGPTGGEGGSASGMWTLDTVLEYEKAGAWPKGFLPRELYTWGLNSSGQLGQGTVANASSPVQVGSLTIWQELVAGNGFAAAITTGGALWAWGVNSSGMLGDGTVVSKSSPVQVGALTNWYQGSGGSAHFLSVKTDGTLWAWGSNANGQLGDGTAVNSSSPVQIGALSTWSSVSASSQSSFAIKADGTLWAWGQNNSGTLGTGNTIYRSSPVQIGALTNWYQVDGGGSQVSAIKTDGTLWTWGENNYGELGQNNGSGFNKSSPVQVGALTNWDKTSAAAFNTSAIKTDGSLWAFGRNSFGQLGINATFPVAASSPVQVGALLNWLKISLGVQAAFAVKTDGTLWSWGNGASGQMGDSTVVSKSSPVQIGAETNWFQIAAGNNFRVATIRG